MLEVEPELSARAEEVRQAQRGGPGDGALAVQNPRHAIGGHFEPPREFSRAHLQGVKFFGKVLPWVNCDGCHTFSLVVIPTCLQPFSPRRRLT